MSKKVIDAIKAREDARAPQPTRRAGARRPAPKPKTEEKAES